MGYTGRQRIAEQLGERSALGQRRESFQALSLNTAIDGTQH